MLYSMHMRNWIIIGVIALITAIAFFAGVFVADRFNIFSNEYSDRALSEGDHIDRSDQIVTDERVQLELPKALSAISSPLVVSGMARGSWYFEATFPIMLVDWDGRIIASHYAEAKQDWMTNDFVPFSGLLEFTSPVEGLHDAPDFMHRGTLIIQRSNASGLPEHDAAVEIPIWFE